ncbi:MAG: hypothetical protein J1F17_07505 [Oscillospiraceae bacterium]|nr:hypothetical protein [Oscillospiraceae bacterium]
MNGCEISASVTALANFIACNFSSEQIEMLAAIFNQLGDTLITINVRQSLCEKKKEKPSA